MLCFAIAPLLTGLLLQSFSHGLPTPNKDTWLAFAEQVSIPIAWLFCFMGLRGKLSLSAFQNLLALHWPAHSKQRLLQTLHLLGLQNLMIFALFALIALNPSTQFNNPLKPFHGMLYWGFAMLVVLVSPVMEELIFRGWLQGHLQNRFSPFVSILSTSLFFTCLHVSYRENGLALAYVFGLGLLYSLWRWQYKSLWPCIIAHCFNNTLALFATSGSYS